MDRSLQALVAAISSFFIVSVILALLILICKSTKISPPQTQTRSLIRTRPSPNPPDLTTCDSAAFDPSLKRLDMAELAAATKNFSSDLIIGDGSFGYVYKATLSYGVTVAIKKLDPNAFQGFREFRAEMETLGKLRHQNIVKILGFCSSGVDRVLIYEFIERGSLDQWLYDEEEEENSVDSLSLSWETRKNIVNGIANGLAYLHGLDTPIIHRDIKASNVLLDADFEPHIADFGLARQVQEAHSHVSTQVAGTMGYMPPEYREGNTAATVMVDVYSFGILMIEIATQNRPNWPVRFEGKDMGLVEWASKMVAQNRETEMIYRKIPNKEVIQQDEVKEYFRIACMCTNEQTKIRPAMTQVVELLNQISSSTTNNN
ncbi:peroxidase 12-like [Hibiscus syriacus]|uniref:Peroxidase 12-like n=1 Tax=Hibiscus syriacus TaxID=106335 RepID=A0A6A3BW69_HIBSY|nr:putative serine/threonine-protein kinase [Hibiscus syriacus]KAE8721110.1 peroxidase 12-like [Hibiscus syriacus]